MTASYLNYEWFLKQDLSNYSGKWVAIVDKKVVGSGSNVNKIINEVKKEYPTKRPFIAKIRDVLSIL